MCQQTDAYIADILDGSLHALQVFDKALTETTFCEIYAELCFQLNAKLPSFEPEVKDGKKKPTTFRSACSLTHFMKLLCPACVMHVRHASNLAWI